MSRSYTETGILPRNYVAMAIYRSRVEADAATVELEHSGFNLQKLSIIDRRGGGGCDRWGHQSVWLDSMGIPPFSVNRYETALKIDKSILIAQWTTEEVVSGCDKINRTNPETVEEHQFSFAATEVGAARIARDSPHRHGSESIYEQTFGEETMG